MLTRLRSSLQTLLHGTRFRRELDDEIAFHIESLTQDLIRSGRDPREARRQARLRFGNVEDVQAHSREARGVALIDEALRNLRFALRGMLRTPLFTGTFILTLGLCVGAGTAVFSAVDGVLWRPLPYPDPDRLALVVTYDPAMGIQPGYSAVDGNTWVRIRDNAESFERAVFSDWPAGVNLSSDDATAYVQQQRVSAGFFRTLGVAPLIGREFDESEDVPGGPAVAILSHGLWKRSFNEDPRIVGRTIRLKGELHTVVAVMPEGFRSSLPADVWTPLRPSVTGEGGGANYRVMVRIPPAMTWEEAEARIGSIETTPSSNPEAPQVRFGLVPLNRAQTADMRQPLLMLLAAILFMLLVGGANLAGLQIARALARRPEIATRQALGGGTGAILRQMVTENLAIGALGGLVGLGIASLSSSGIEALLQSHFDTWQTLHLNGRTLGAALGLTVAATLLFGLAPVLQVRNFDVRGVLAGGSRTVVGSSGAHRLRKVFLVGEVALVTALLFGAGLLARSYDYLDRLDPGFDADNVLTVQLSLNDARYSSAAEVNRFLDETLAGIARQSGVRSAAVALTLPYERPLNMPFKIVGVEDPEGTYRITNLVYVTPGFFEALGIPLLRGRNLETADGSDAPSVAVANQAFVEANLAAGAEIGSRLTFAGREWEVVGVSGDVQQSRSGWGSSEPIWKAPTLYIPAAQAGEGFFRGIHIWFSPSWLVKTSGSPVGLAAAITRAIHDVDPDMPLARVTLLSDVMAKALARERFEAAFLIVVAGFALLLAAVGLYGIVANEVVERTTEMGLRMALGASAGKAVWTVGSSGLRLTLLGLMVGAVLSAFIAPSIAHAVWGVVPYDPVTLLGVAIALTALAATASFVPAARIARLEPSRILRDQ